MFKRETAVMLPGKWQKAEPAETGIRYKYIYRATAAAAATERRLEKTSLKVPVCVVNNGLTGQVTRLKLMGGNWFHYEIIAGNGSRLTHNITGLGGCVSSKLDPGRTPGNR